MGNLALLDAPSRLARKLLELAEAHGVADLISVVAVALVG
jgi:hypothetical protein